MLTLLIHAIGLLLGCLSLSCSILYCPLSAPTSTPLSTPLSIPLLPLFSGLPPSGQAAHRRYFFCISRC